jgi:CDP-4-dehydro-6-deoxyglucose reductase
MGQELHPRSGESILDSALRAGVNLPHSCKSGNCGSCLARLLEGEVSYPFGPPMGLNQEDLNNRSVLLCQAQAVGDVVVEALVISRAGQAQVKRLPCRVHEMTVLCHDVMRLVLRLPAVEPLEFLAGQYVDLMLSEGRRRSFSIASSPSEPTLLELHIRRVPEGEFTGQVFEQIQSGAVLRMQGPFGNFTLQDSTRPWLMVAGGTGLAPIKSMLDWSLEQAEQRPIRLYWGVRRQEDLYALDTLERYRSEFNDFAWTPVLSEADGDTDWRGATGLVHRAVINSLQDLWSYDVYVAGPPALVNAAREELPEAGANPASIFFDSFDYAPDSLRAIAGVD